MSNFSAILYWVQVTFQWDDDEVHVVLDQHAYLDFYKNCVSGVMVRVLTSSVVDCGFDPWSGRTKEYKLVLLLLC
jgi:hypothetical protein